MSTHQLLNFNNISIIDEADRTLLDDVSGSIYGGDRIVLMGASGSGKSLLLSALASQIPLTQGQICLAYANQMTDITSIPPPHLRQQIALLMQTPVMVDGTVRDNLMLPFGFGHHKAKQFDERRHIAWLARFGKSADFIHQDITKLSGGERQIVHFLRTLQLEPTLLLLDEPTAALDTVSAGVLMSLVHEWLDGHRAYIWISHRTDEVATLGNQSWQMMAGRLECVPSVSVERI
ncbi:ABC transporter ATP-binding protein [Moraxella porci]|uniref:ABC transporter ATP-binding protein n=1 Tax=Moraxella porci TaxID=1288392 RepID=UPI002448D300|nr:ATP-binding cassette domain-containing protein [Moraxella porci]MDH2272462.1 ATP-binding cassette domain-containing protein [Moraxella porci]